MKRKSLKKFRIARLVGLSTLVGGVGIFLHQTGYIDDARFLLGGVFRGMRCAKTGMQIAYTYVYVKIILI
jgi:hypothetical protein